MSDARSYLIFEDVQKDPSLKPYFDACARAILDGTAKISRTRVTKDELQRACFRAEGKEILVDAILTFYLHELSLTAFSYKKAREFSERIRKLAGFSAEVSYPLKQWVYRHLRDPYFYNQSEVFFMEDWVIKPDEPHDAIPEDYFWFACHVAICFMKYGERHGPVTANRIYGFVSALGSPLVEHFKMYGSGSLSRSITRHRDRSLFCFANDAFATIRIALKTESEAAYAKILDFLCTQLKSEFPCSYAIDFRSPEKNFLPIRGLPKKGVHQLFANAVRYPALHKKIAQYAQLAMKKFEWYTNLEGENCALPGTFAVFALGLSDKKYTPLVINYLECCDDEHSTIQGKFIVAWVEKFGLGEEGLQVFVRGANSVQELPPHKVYARAAANEDSLKRLLATKNALEPHLWTNVLYALWGEDAIHHQGEQTLKNADPALKPLYEEILKA